MTTEWFPERLNAAILRSFEASLAAALADAERNAPSSLAGAKVVQTGATSARLIPTGQIGAILEKGAHAHEIPVGEKGYLYVGGGQFVSGTISHPGSPPKPYVHPAAFRWSHGGYQTVARATLDASGF